ncbi:hypothetical protein GCM10027265_28020 [Jatrophihabitans fulvus]
MPFQILLKVDSSAPVAGARGRIVTQPWSRPSQPTCPCAVRGKHDRGHGTARPSGDGRAADGGSQTPACRGSAVESAASVTGFASRPGISTA